MSAEIHMEERPARPEQLLQHELQCVRTLCKDLIDSVVTGNLRVQKRYVDPANSSEVDLDTDALTVSENIQHSDFPYQLKKMDTMANAESEYLSEIEKICDGLWQSVQNMHIENKDKLQPQSLEEESSILLQILREKESIMHSEIDVLKTATPSLLPNNEHALHTLLVDELKESNKQLEEVKTIVEVQHREISHMISQEMLKQEQLKSIESCLLLELQELQRKPHLDVTMTTVMTELDMKISKVKAMNATLTKEIVKFLDQHYPLPKSDDFKGMKKYKSSLKDIVPLKVILQELMNKCVDEAHDPYIEITERYWPPYVELLHRYQIAIRHPDDYTRMRLVPFHL